LKQSEALSKTLFNIVLEKVRRDIETNSNKKFLNRTRECMYSICRECVDTGQWVTATEVVETQIKEAAVSTGLGINESKTKYMTINSNITN
jgi:hypothetical protein